MAVSEGLMAWIVFVVSAAVIVYAGTKLSKYGDQIADLFNCRSLESSMFRIGVFSNRWIVAGLLAIVGLQLLLTYVPVINRLIHTAPIDGLAWAPILATGLAVFAVVGGREMDQTTIHKETCCRASA